MIRSLAVMAVATAVCACSSTFYEESADEIRLEAGVGGLVEPIMERYAAFRESGKKVVIDGPMISADAFGAFSLPNACYTKNAVFSPHSVSDLGLIPMPDYTRRLANELPSGLRDWFVSSHWFYNPILWPHIGYERLLRLWPEGACKEDEGFGRALQAPEPIRRADL